jgi:hypothetical protein
MVRGKGFDPGARESLERFRRAGVDLAQVQMNDEAGKDAPGAPHYCKERKDIVRSEFPGRSKSDGRGVHVDGNGDGEFGGHRKKILYEARKAAFITSFQITGIVPDNRIIVRHVTPPVPPGGRLDISAFSQARTDSGCRLGRSAVGPGPR